MTTVEETLQLEEKLKREINSRKEWAVKNVDDMIYEDGGKAQRLAALKSQVADLCAVGLLARLDRSLQHGIRGVGPLPAWLLSHMADHVMQL